MKEIPADAAGAEMGQGGVTAPVRITIQYLLKKNREDLLSVAEPMLLRTLPFLLLTAAIIFFVVQRWIVSPVAEYARSIERILATRSNRRISKSMDKFDAYESVARTEIREFLALTKSFQKIFRTTWIIKENREKIIHDDFKGLGQAIKIKAELLRILAKKSIEMRARTADNSMELNSRDAERSINKAFDLEKNIDENV